MPLFRGGLGPWLRFWQRVRNGLCAGGAGCAQRLVRRGGGAQQLVPGTGRVRNGVCVLKGLCAGGGGAQRLVPGGCAQRLEGFWRGGGEVGLCLAVGGCAQRLVRGGAQGVRGEIPRGCPGFTTPQAVNSVFTRTIASAKS